MNIKKNVGKMFKVLVLSSTIIAANAVMAEDAKECQLELRDKSKILIQQTTCLDDFNKELTLNEILKEIEDDQSNSCLTPFCNCWLG